MTTTLSIDKEVKDKAYIRAKIDKIPLSTVAKILLLDYAEGRINISTRLNSNINVSEIEVDDEIQQKMNNLSTLWNSIGK